MDLRAFPDIFFYEKEERRSFQLYGNYVKLQKNSETMIIIILFPHEFNDF